MSNQLITKDASLTSAFKNGGGRNVLTKFSSLPLHPNRFLKNAFLVFAILIVLFSFVGYASAFAGGDGSSGDPYQIETEAHLILVSSNLNSYFILIDDITLTSPWTPIGSSAAPFTGSFDGQNFTISNFNFVGATNDVGLFGATEGSTIENVRLTDVMIVMGGGNNISSLVGFANNTAIENSHAFGEITYPLSSSPMSSVIGGLVGYMYSGSVSNSSAAVNVTGSGTVGGLVGWMTGGDISNSFASGDVKAEGGAHAGGLVSVLVSGGNISNSYATGNVTGNGIVGGLVGEANGDGLIHAVISNSFATGNVVGDQHVGGLIGATWFSSISSSYATGNVTGNIDVGGLVGWVIGNDIISNSMALNEFVSGTSQVYRDFGTIGASNTISNIFVWENMSINGVIGTAPLSSASTDVTSLDVWRTYPANPIWSTFDTTNWILNYYGKFLLPVHQWSIDSELGYAYVIANATHLIPEFQVIYDGNLHRSGTVPADLIIHLATDVATILGPGDLAKPGYVFTGWRTFDGVLPVETFQPGDTRLMTTSIVLFAQWEPETSMNCGGGGGRGTGNATIVPPVTPPITVTPPTGNVTPPDNGADIGYVSPPETGSVPEESSISWLWWLLLLIGILLVIFFFILLYRRRKKEEDEQKMK